MHTVEILTSLVENHHLVAYLLLYGIVIFEGEVAAIVAGILVHLGAFNLPITLVLVFLGGITKTIFGYKIGKFCFEHYNHNGFFRYMKKKVSSFLPNFKRRPFWSIFISKFIIGANHIVILFSGFERINYRKYFKAELGANLVWAPLMISLGYFFSYAALRISQEIWRYTMVIIIFILMFIIFDKMVSWLYEVFEEFQEENNE